MMCKKRVEKMKEEGGGEDESKARPPKAGLIKVGQALQSCLQMLSHMDPVYTCLDLALIG